MNLEEARTRYTEAATALDQMAGPDGVIRHQDVDLVAGAARELDDGVTADLRIVVIASANELFRAGALSTPSAGGGEAARVHLEHVAEWGQSGNLMPIDHGPFEDVSLSLESIDPSLGVSVDL